MGTERLLECPECCDFGVQLRDLNGIREENRDYPAYPVESDVDINTQEVTDHDLSNLHRAVERVTGIGAGSSQEANHVRQQQAESEVSSQAAGFESPWMQPEDQFNYLLKFDVIPQHGHPTNEEQRDNPSHNAETHVAIDRNNSNDVDNQARAIGGVTDFKEKTSDETNNPGGNHGLPNNLIKVNIRPQRSAGGASPLQPYQLSRDIPVLQLKKDLEREMDIPAEYQRWFVRNTELDNNKTLVGNNIHFDDTIYVQGPSASLPLSRPAR